MTHNHERTVAELRRESERTRAELSQTIEALKTKITDTASDIRQKASPESIKAEVSDYVAEKGRHWMDNLKQQAMDNPIQTMAAAAAVAVPALKLARAVPIPLWLIGVGFALASPRARNAIAGSLPLGEIDRTVAETREQARSGLQRVQDQAQGAMAETRDKAFAKAADLREATSQLVDDVKDRATGYCDAVRETISATADMAHETLRTSQQKATETIASTRRSAESMVRDNSAVVGGIGLAIGALIAAALPSTAVERQTMGDASDVLRQKAVDEMKSAAAGTAEKVGERVTETFDQVAQKLKTVTEEAVTTAFEPSTTHHH
jgi:ElaB/YqjD/DUF883 family membrane-anchored ribosome-binding protein